MQLKLKLEDEVIDVPDTAEIEPDPSKEILNEFKTVDGFFEVINNFRHLQAHIKKFGVTKEFLHLVNENNQLNLALNISLPCYESDEEGNEVEDIDIDNLPGTEDELITTMEGFIGKTKDKIVEFFKWMKDKLVQFWNWLKGLFSKKEKEVKAAQESIKPENIAKEAEKTLKEELETIIKAEPKAEKSELDIKVEKARENLSKTVEESQKAIKSLDQLWKDQLGQISFWKKTELDNWITKFSKAFDELGRTKLNLHTATYENGSNLCKVINEVTGSQLKISENLIAGTLIAAWKTTFMNDWMAHQHNPVPFDELGYDRELTDLNNYGSKIISLIKRSEKLGIFIKNHIKTCDEFIRKSQDALGLNTPIESTIVIRQQMNIPISILNVLNKNINILITSYNIMCGTCSRGIKKGILKEIKLRLGEN